MRQTDRQSETDDSIMSIADHTACMVVQSAKTLKRVFYLKHVKSKHVLADRTATQYCLLSVTPCIVAERYV